MQDSESKATLSYSLPEDKNELLMAINGKDYLCVLWDLDQKLRSISKYGHKYKSVEEIVEELREEIREEIDFSILE